MDSLTQITLGAAVGEVVLGRKVGNRAMLWGAIGGTLPDMDVLASFASGEISSLAYHRAITHSLTYAFLTPAALGWLVYRVYEHQNDFWERGIWRDFGRLGLFLGTLLWAGTMVLPIPWNEALGIGLTVAIGMLFFPMAVFLREKVRRAPSFNGNATWREWAWLMFWAIVTHPLLDSCTTFGTQLFQPFHNYRVALNNIAVADPAYTLPFLICLIIAARLTRGSRLRRWFNLAGILISSAYMLFTFGNKLHIDHVFSRSLKEQGIVHSRFTASPSILNNILWEGVAEGDTAMYVGSYSLLDREPRVRDFQAIPKHHELLAPYAGQRDPEVLRWFANGYFTLEQLPDSSIVWSDWRYGGFPGKDGRISAIFRFRLKDENGELKAAQSEEGPEDGEQMLKDFWKRIKGY